MNSWNEFTYTFVGVLFHVTTYHVRYIKNENMFYTIELFYVFLNNFFKYKLYRQKTRFFFSDWGNIAWKILDLAVEMVRCDDESDERDTF